MENNPGTKTTSGTRTATRTIRETLLKVCRHYQEPGLGEHYASVARYYEKQVTAIPPPPEPTAPARARS